MAPAAVAALWAGGLVFALLVGAAVLVMWLEWGAMMRRHDGTAAEGVTGLRSAATAPTVNAPTVNALAAGALLAVAAGFPVIGWAGGGALLMGLVAIVQGLTAGENQRGVWLGGGALYIGLPGLALVWLREHPENGFLLVLWLLLVIWASDSLAYAFGKTIGGPKLAPGISPNKTWAGLCGAVVGAGLAGVSVGYFAGGVHLGVLALAAAVLGLVGQGGDFFESAIKRHVGAKDSGTLIPGHGGVLDRLDSTLASAPILALAIWLGENKF